MKNKNGNVVEDKTTTKKYYELILLNYHQLFFKFFLYLSFKHRTTELLYDYISSDTLKLNINI